MVVLEPTAEEAETEGGFKEVEKDGSFELQGILGGSYALQVYLHEQGWFVKLAHPGNEDAFQKGVQVEDGAAKGNLEIVVSNEGAQLEGTVTDSETNQPLAAAQIKLRVDPENEFNRNRWNQASTDQNGHYVIKDVPPGKYKVTARIPSPGDGAPAIKSGRCGNARRSRAPSRRHQADCSERRVNGAGDYTAITKNEKPDRILSTMGM